MTPELHRLVPLDRIGRDGLDFHVDATQAECSALAARMLLPGIVSLTCAFHLTRESDKVTSAHGRLIARVVRTCVVSLDEFEETVDEGFAIRFVPAGEEDEDNIDPDAVDEVPYEGRALDLGEAAAEQLGLALDPYPRKPDATLPELEDDTDRNPFAALNALRRPN